MRGFYLSKIGVNSPSNKPVLHEQKINDFLVKNGLLIKNNPAISPDATLDFPSIIKELSDEIDVVTAAITAAQSDKTVPQSGRIILWSKSNFSLGKASFYVVESRQSGDCALVTVADDDVHFEGTTKIGTLLKVIPLWWENLVQLKNALFAHDPNSTIFPRVDPRLKRTSLGIGARFTTLHWPAVAWAMKTLSLPLTANQNSVPRELVYDTDALSNGTLGKIPFPFIGDSVPEGHQGQSIKGMSHASIITLLKYGFHHNRIPWGFNADHQPIGGRFDAIETELVEGSLFASYITYDLSPELSLHTPINDPEELDSVFSTTVTPDFFEAILEKITSRGLNVPEQFIKMIAVYLMPAMKKLKQRDQRYRKIREQNFQSEVGRSFIRELSIDELPGDTSPDALAVCLAMTEALGITFDFIAPNVGFQKNCPYPDSVGLQQKIKAFVEIARKFDVSIGFHSGSGKSAENYRIIGTETDGNFEIKTSGRFTYEMGVALSHSSDPFDRKLWTDWYEFTKDLTIAGAFSAEETAKRFARDFVSTTFAAEGRTINGVFNSPENLKQALDSLKPSTEHVFWFEYNFLFVLAAKGNIERLGDHSIEGYKQRSRFYSISDQAKLLFAGYIAKYILFLAESTGIACSESIEKARRKLADFQEYSDLLADIA